ADSPLLRADHGLAGGRAVGLAAPWHVCFLGRRRRNPLTAGSPIVRTMIRRASDVVVSSLALALSAPVLAVAMLAVRLESPGPAIYTQRRAGRGGREFDVLKLRTMVDGAEHIGAGLAIDADDPRVTRVGAFLRRTSLDEL